MWCVDVDFSHLSCWFLCGRDTLVEHASVYVEEDFARFAGKEKNYPLCQEKEPCLYIHKFINVVKTVGST